jgi:hypothetical protein
MGMTRGRALTYLDGQFNTGPAPLQAEAGVSTIDDEPNYGAVIDDALLILGVPYDDLATAEVAADKVGDYRVLLRYYALTKFVDALGTRLTYNVSGTGVTELAGALFNQAKSLQAEAKAQAAARGYDVSNEQGAVMRTLMIDIYEPDTSGDGDV